AVSGVKVPAVNVDRARVVAEVSGRDLLSPLRSETDPIDVHAIVEGNRTFVGTGSAAIAVEKGALDAKAPIARLFEPARKPISAKIALGVGAVNLEGRGLAVEGAKIDVDARSTDPRRGGALDSKATVAVRAKTVSTPEASLEDARIRLTADAS